MRLSSAIAKVLIALGYPVTVVSRSMPADPLTGADHLVVDALDTVLGRTDILVNVLPLTPQTEGLLNAETFSKLPRGAALIQIGRGRQLIEDDLIAALDSGRLSGASLDVFEEEPLPPTSPLWSHPALFLTPHVASTPTHRAVVENVTRGLASL